MDRSRSPLGDSVADPFRAVRRAAATGQVSYARPTMDQAVRGIIVHPELRRELLRQCWLQYPEEVASVGLDIVEMLESYAGTGHERHLLRSLEGVSAMRATLERVWCVTGRDRT